MSHSAGVRGLKLFENFLQESPFLVALCRSAWIEICGKRFPCYIFASHSAGVRGLKSFYMFFHPLWSSLSHSAGVRGLKFKRDKHDLPHCVSHSAGVRGLKFSIHSQHNAVNHVALCRSAWIEISSGTTPVIIKLSRTLQECVD